jgi:hypothetical protein
MRKQQPIINLKTGRLWRTRLRLNARQSTSRTDVLCVSSINALRREFNQLTRRQDAIMAALEMVGITDDRIINRMMATKKGNDEK